jgi:hypothetical protein
MCPNLSMHDKHCIIADRHETSFVVIKYHTFFSLALAERHFSRKPEAGAEHAFFRCDIAHVVDLNTSLLDLSRLHLKV